MRREVRSTLAMREDRTTHSLNGAKIRGETAIAHTNSTFPNCISRSLGESDIAVRRLAEAAEYQPMLKTVISAKGKVCAVIQILSEIDQSSGLSGSSASNVHARIC
jgi:hypothetical protein